MALDQSDYPVDMTVWAQFHNGVATALKIGSGVDSVSVHVTVM